MNERIKELKTLIEELEEIDERSLNMSISWNSGDDYDMAENDPGLQYELDMERERKVVEIKNICRRIGVEE